MGQRGPAPTPRKILEARGSWRANANPGEPVPEPGRPTRPRSVKGEARKVWDKLLPMLERMGLLSKIDGWQLERYCVYFARWRRCEEYIAAHGMSMEKAEEGGLVERPELKESLRLDKALKQIEANFGLSPSARTRLRVPDREDDSDDDLKAFRIG